MAASAYERLLAHNPRAGQEYTSSVTLTSEAVLVNQSIGVADVAVGFDQLKADGILGYGCC